MSTDDRRDMPDVLIAIGSVLLDQDDNNAAVETFSQARSLSHDLTDHHLEAIALGRLGEAYLRSGDPESAKQSLKKAVDLRRRVPDAHEEANLARWLAEVDAAHLS
ncbi:tetratricopeptide repeat protein [Kibdelosporangium lantanae]|uniref:Tetratricopeptide repeat protein n=1 Tax=Kibdelosporangium lantanae TaxID=1497396 RepID=A0ABW3MEM9_9PSEU